MQAVELHTSQLQLGHKGVWLWEKSPQLHRYALEGESTTLLPQGPSRDPFRDPSQGPPAPQGSFGASKLSQAGCGDSRPRLHQDTQERSATLSASPQPSQVAGPSPLWLRQPRFAQRPQAQAARPLPALPSTAERQAVVAASLPVWSSGDATSEVTITRYQASLARQPSPPPTATAQALSLPAWHRWHHQTASG